jgi:hypothetical protein
MGYSAGDIIVFIAMAGTGLFLAALAFVSAEEMLRH